MSPRQNPLLLPSLSPIAYDSFLKRLQGPSAAANWSNPAGVTNMIPGGGSPQPLSKKYGDSKGLYAAAHGFHSASSRSQLRCQEQVLAAINDSAITELEMSN